jgi:hypothetical protein
LQEVIIGYLFSSKIDFKSAGISMLFSGGTLAPPVLPTGISAPLFDGGCNYNDMIEFLTIRKLKD